VKSCTALLPLMVMFRPLPLIVSASFRKPRVTPRLIVPLTLKLIVSAA
jgi:hypothetical protein